MVHNPRKVRKKREKLSWVLVRDGEDEWVLGLFYIELVHEVLLYGSDMWVISPRIVRKMGGFHHKVVRRLTRRQPRRKMDGTWVHLPLEEAMSEAGIHEVENYVTRHRNTVA